MLENKATRKPVRRYKFSVFRDERKKTATRLFRRKNEELPFDVSINIAGSRLVLRDNWMKWSYCMKEKRVVTTRIKALRRRHSRNGDESY